MNDKGRGWIPQSKLQTLFFSTYNTKKSACLKMDVSPTTLRRLFINEDRFTLNQLRTLAMDSKLSVCDISKLI